VQSTRRWDHHSSLKRGHHSFSTERNNGPFSGFAWNIARRLSEKTRLTDWDYSFDLLVPEMSSVEELIENARDQAEEQ
jgi:hypothetical protein